MEKIKINTTSGGVLEKPLVTAFKSTNGEYVALDNEMNGTMGLPIILVSKLVNNSLSVVPDTEWNAVKEILRLIISGNQVDYISVPNTLGAEDVFFKQLTLPVASFDVLKNSYKPVGAIDTPVQPQVAAEPVMPVNLGAPEVVSTPEVTPVASEPVMPVNLGAPEIVSTPEVTPVASEPVMPVNIGTPEIVSEPIQMPNISPAPSEPVMPAAPVESQVVAPVMPEVTVAPMPSVEPIPEASVETPVDFTADKEAFLKACENMFDALVAKFNNR